MLVNNSCAALSDSQLEFLKKIIPISRTIQSQVIVKLQDKEIPIHTETGIYASVVAALCIHRSNWGTHKVAQEKFYRKDKNAINGNNLALVNADASWTRARQTILYAGRTYKSYRDTTDFAVDLSDIIAWKYDYSKVLAARTHEEQIEIMSRRSLRRYYFQSELLKIIRDFNLKIYDVKIT